MRRRAVLGLIAGCCGGDPAAGAAEQIPDPVRRINAVLYSGDFRTAWNQYRRLADAEDSPQTADSLTPAYCRYFAARALALMGSFDGAVDELRRFTRNRPARLERSARYGPAGTQVLQAVYGLPDLSLRVPDPRLVAAAKGDLKPLNLYSIEGKERWQHREAVREACLLLGQGALMNGRWQEALDYLGKVELDGSAGDDPASQLSRTFLLAARSRSVPYAGPPLRPLLSREDARVFSAVLDDRSDDKPWVIERETTPANSLARDLRRGQWAFPSVYVLLLDFEQRNSRSVPMPDFQLDKPAVFANASDIRALFRTGFWPEFYRAYPNSRGLIGLTLPAYSPDGTEALFHYRRSSGGLNGEGALMLMEKVNDRWRVKHRFTLRVS